MESLRKYIIKKAIIARLQTLISELNEQIWGDVFRNDELNLLEQMNAMQDEAEQKPELVAKFEMLKKTLDYRQFVFDQAEREWKKEYFDSLSWAESENLVIS